MRPPPDARRPLAQKLITYQGNARAFKALIAAEYNGVTIEVPDFEWGVTNKSEEFLAKNPVGKVPVLETAEGAWLPLRARGTAG